LWIESFGVAVRREMVERGVGAGGIERGKIEGERGVLRGFGRRQLRRGCGWWVAVVVPVAHIAR
jgi:hypothetical protein